MLTLRLTRNCALLLLVATLPASLFAQGSSADNGKSKNPDKGTSEPPPVQGSMVGYIDNAIVGSQIRIRFDAGFGDTQPDLAEWFYAACSCNGNNGAAAAGPEYLATRMNFQQYYLRGEVAPEDHLKYKRLSLLFELPLRAIQPTSFDPNFSPSPGDNEHEGGLSDVSAGLKMAVVARESAYLTIQTIITFPSGDSTKGLGTDHHTFAPALLYYQKVTGRFFVEGEFGDSHPIGGDVPGFAGDVVEYGVGPSFVANPNGKVHFAPVVEFVGWRIFGGKWSNPETEDPATLKNPGQAPGPNKPDNADASKILNLKAGVRTTVGKNDSFYVGYGHALTSDNLFYQNIVRVEYRRTF